jgi:hypothetical protein
MTLDDLISELTARHYRLHYLRQPRPTIWEALVCCPLEQSVNGYTNAIGYGQSYSPVRALADALDAVERDPTIDIFEPAENAPSPPPARLDIMAIVRAGEPAETPSPFTPRRLS